MLLSPGTQQNSQDGLRRHLAEYVGMELTGGGGGVVGGGPTNAALLILLGHNFPHGRVTFF